MLKEDASDVEPGLYVCGWVKRGPTGIIGAPAPFMCLCQLIACKLYKLARTLPCQTGRQSGARRKKRMLMLAAG